MNLADIGLMEIELMERGIIAPPEFGKDELRAKIMEIIVTEGKDSDLGRQIWQYCKIVEFDYEAIKPILDKDPNFFSQLEELGSIQFNFMLLQVKELKKLNEFARLASLFFTPRIVIEPGTINPDDWEKKITDPGMRLTLINSKELTKKEVNYDNLMPGYE